MSDENPDDKLDDETKDIVDKVDDLVDHDDEATDGGTDEQPDETADDMFGPEEPDDTDASPAHTKPPQPSPGPQRNTQQDAVMQRLDELESVVTEEDGEDAVETEPPEEDGSWIGGVGAGFGNFLGGLTSFPPLRSFGSRFWKAMAHTSLKNYHRAHGGDRTALEYFPNGKAKFTPVKWKSVEECDEDEGAGWKVKGRDKTYKPTTMGQGGFRVGKVPILNLDNETWRGTSILESRVAEAVDQGDHRPLYRVDEAELSATVNYTDNYGATTGPVSSDGGQNVQEARINPRTQPIFDDVIIDLGSDDYDGQAVSFTKVKELMAERTTSDEMAAQEERGFRAGRSKKDLKSFLIKVMLIGGAIAAAGLIGPELVGALFGTGGGGGGGGVIPF